MAKRRTVIVILRKLPGFGKWEDVQQFEKNEVQCVGITLSNLKKENAGTYRVIQRTVRNNE